MLLLLLLDNKIFNLALLCPVFEIFHLKQSHLTPLKLKDHTLLSAGKG